MMEQRLSQAFHTALADLQRGQALEDVLRAYPDLADELRPLLQIASTIPNARLQNGEIAAMRSRLDPQFERQLAAHNFPKQPSRRPLLAFVASLALLFLGFWLFFPRNENLTATEVHLTQIIPLPTETAIVPTRPTTIAPSITPSPTLPIILTHTSTPAATCTPRTDWEEYQLISGDTLSAIALNSGTTVEALLIANCLDNPRNLIVGQRIYVPRLWENADNSEFDADNSETEDSDSSENNDPLENSGSDDDANDNEPDNDEADDVDEPDDDENSGSNSDDD